MRKDHDLAAWLIFASLAGVLGLLALIAGVPLPGFVLLAVGVGIAVASVTRWRRVSAS